MGMFSIIKGVFSKNKDSAVVNDPIHDVKTWYNDRYEDAIIQRNLLFVGIVICLGVIFFSLLVIGYVNNSNTIEPFVIEIEKKRVYLLLLIL